MFNRPIQFYCGIACLLLAQNCAFSYGEDAESGSAAVTQHSAEADRIERRTFCPADSKRETTYLVYLPTEETGKRPPSLVVFLYGAGGSLDNFNYGREPYAILRKELAQRGYYVVVPDLGKLHFMNDEAKSTLDGLVSELLTTYSIPPERVHVMGTSMGGGSSLAYAIHRPKNVRSVCAIMPMTDFESWTRENPKYAKPVATAFGGTPEQVPQAYRRNSAIQQPDAFAETSVLLIHGRTDETVRFHHSANLDQLLQERQFNCTLLVDEKLGHVDEIVRAHQMQIADFFDAAGR